MRQTLAEYIGPIESSATIAASDPPKTFHENFSTDQSPSEGSSALSGSEQRDQDHFKNKVKFIWIVVTDEHKRRLVNGSRIALSIEDFYKYAGLI